MVYDSITEMFLCTPGHLTKPFERFFYPSINNILSNIHSLKTFQSTKTTTVRIAKACFTKTVLKDIVSVFFCPSEVCFKPDKNLCFIKSSLTWFYAYVT